MRIKKYSLILFLFIHTIAAFSQYCNERYDFNNKAETGFAVQENDSGFVVCAARKDSLNYLMTALIFYDTACNVRYTKSYGKPYNFYYPGVGGTLIKTYDAGYALGGGVKDSAGTASAILIKFNYTGDTLWTKRFYYGVNEFITTYQVKQTPDSGYILVGAADPNGSTDAFLIKTDSLGNEQWRNTYGTNFTEYGFSVMITSDNHYLIGGTYCTTCSPSNGDMAVFKVNSGGALVWQKNYGNPLEDEASAIVGHEFPDGSYLFGGCWRYDMGEKMTVLRIDTNGDQIWRRDISNFGGVNTSVQSVKTINDTIVLLGGFYPNYPYSLSGVIAKVDINGTLLMKNLLDYGQGSDSDMFWDIIPTSDGRYAATGTTNDGQQDVWFVKTDEYGCILPGCEQPEEYEDGNIEYLSGVEEINEENPLKIYPNPAGSYTILEFSAPGNYELTITSADGKIIEKTTFKSKSYSIDTGLFPNGIYFVNVWTGDKLKTGRLVVIR